MMKAKRWLAGWFLLVLAALGLIGYEVYKVDPYFHYHKPDTTQYYYSLSNQRSQNDGISKHFDYDALITGTSMTENFKTSEFDKLFGVHSIKVPYSGGSYKEMNDNLKIALRYNPNLKTIVRCLDMGMFFDSADRMRTDLGKYPTYLYDENPFNDVQYLFNKDIIFGWTYAMMKQNDASDFTPGITSFDDYSNWNGWFTFGKNTVVPDGMAYTLPAEEKHLTEEEKQTITQNITQNVTSLADQYPDVDFYYFFSPYSIAWWNGIANGGELNHQLEAEEFIIELILEHPNIHLFSFNNRTDITTDLNNYKDAPHYGQWINSLMLKWMHDGKYQLTKENYQDYLRTEREYYSNLTENDIRNLNEQPDYENDFYADALLNEELNGVVPKKLSGPEPFAEDTVSAALEEKPYRYLVFEAQKQTDGEAVTVMVRNGEGETIGQITLGNTEGDTEWHQYLLAIPTGTDAIEVDFTSPELTSEQATYLFRSVTIY